MFRFFFFQVGQCLPSLVHSAGDCTYSYANIQSFKFQSIWYSFTFLKFIFFVHLFFLIPYLIIVNSAIYFTLQQINTDRSVGFLSFFSVLSCPSSSMAIYLISAITSTSYLFHINHYYKPLKKTDCTTYIPSSCFTNR